MGSVPRRWFAVGLLVASLLAFVLVDNFQDYWAFVLLAVGILLLVTSLVPKKPSEPTPREPILSLRGG